MIEQMKKTMIWLAAAMTVGLLPGVSAPSAAAQDVAAAPRATCFDARDRPTCPPAQIRADVAKLVQSLTQLRQLTAGARNRLQEGGATPSLQEVQEALPVMHEVAALVSAEIGPFFAEFTQRYARMERNYTEPRTGAGLEEFGDAVSSTYIELQALLASIREAGPISARVCLHAVTLQLDNMDTINPMLLGRVMGNMQAMLELCPQFEPTNQEVLQQVTQLRPRLAELAARYAAAELAAARDRRWETNAAGAPAHAAAGLAFLRDNETFGRVAGTRVVAVSVRGDWSVARRNIFGQPAQWGLPVHVAIVKTNTRPELAQVYEMTLVTRGAERQPNFLEYWVGNTWNVLRTAVPGAGAAAAAAPTRPARPARPTRRRR